MEFKMEKKYKIIVAHPGKQHSFQLATALKNEDMLYKYITTVYDKKGSLTAVSKKFLKGKLKRKANTRSIDTLNDNDIIQFYELLGLILIFISKIPYCKTIWEKLNNKIGDMFGKKVAKYDIKHNVDAVICYDTNCTKLFKILKEKAPNIKRIMDVSIANRLYMKEVFIKDIKTTGNDKLKKEQKRLWNNKYLKRC